MGAKCLRPQKAMFPVYVSQLNKIYQQALEAHRNYENLQDRNIDLIANIETSLKHKGSLKKLIDHLSSHKSKIYDTLQHCLVLVSSSQNYIFHVTTGIILKKIVELLQSIRSDQSSNQKTKQTKASNDQAIDQGIINKQNINKLNRCYSKSQGDQVKKAETVFFKLIDLILLKDRQLNLISYISKVLADFSAIKGTAYLDTKTVSSILEKLVHLMRIIPKSITNIRNSILQAYLFTLQNFKFNTINETFAKSHIRFFLHQWSNDLQSKPFRLQVSSSEHCQHYQREIIEGIIRCFLQNSIGSIEWQYVLQEVLFLYDHYHFNQKIIPIEQVLFHSASSYALRQQFRHRSFDYVINYLSVVKQQEQSIVLQFDFNYFEDMKAKYLFIVNQDNKINCISTLMRWAQIFKQETLETLRYQKYHLFESLFVNLATKNSELYKKIVAGLQFFTEIYTESYQTVLQMIVSSLNHINAKQSLLLTRILNIARNISSKEVKIQNFHVQALFAPITSKNLDKSWYLIDLIMCFIEKVDFYHEIPPVQALCRFLHSIILITTMTETGSFYQMQFRLIKHCEIFYKAIAKYVQIIQAFKEALIIRLKKSVKELVFQNLIVVQKCINQDCHQYLDFIKNNQISLLKIKKNMKEFQLSQSQYQKQLSQLFQQYNFERSKFVKLVQLDNTDIYDKAILIMASDQNMLNAIQHKQSMDMYHRSRSLSIMNQENSISVSDSTFVNIVGMIKIV